VVVKIGPGGVGENDRDDGQSVQLTKCPALVKECIILYRRTER
jgi:hypothetical protein